jgi:hypothetical protein
MAQLLQESDVIQGWVSARHQYSFHPWDPVGELIQGAVRELLDCPDKHFRSLSGLNEILDISISEKDKTIKILDYGRGFPDLSWLALNKSTHPQAKKVESGFGLGLTAVLAQSDNFSIVSRWASSPDIMEVEFTNVNSDLDQAISDKESGKSVDPKLLQASYSKCTRKISNIPLKSGWTGPFTYFEIKGDTGMSHMWDFIGLEGGGVFLSSLLYHSALGLTHRVHGKKLPRKIPYSYTFEDGTGKSFLSQKIIGDHKLKPGLPHCTKITDATKAIPKGTNPHFLSYEFKGKPGTKPDHIIAHIQAYAAFADHGGKKGKERISDAYGNFLQQGKTKGGSSNIFISVNNFPQPIRVEIPQMGNKSTLPWTVIWIDVDKNVMESGRNALSKEAAEQLNPKIIDAVNTIEKKYHADKGSTSKPAGIPTGIGGKGTKKSTGKTKILSAPKIIGTTTISGGITGPSAAPSSAATSTTPKTPLIWAPTSEGEVDLVFATLCQSGFISDIEIAQYGNTSTTYDWDIRPNWPLSDCGAQYQIELQNHATILGLKITMASTVYDIIKTELVCESKHKIKDFVKQVTSTGHKKKIDEVDIVICWDKALSKPMKAEWDLRVAIPDEKFHPKITHILESTINPAKSAQVFVLSEFFP